MNIIHVGKYYPPYHGGIEVSLRDLAEQQAHKHKVTALVHNHKFKNIFSKIDCQTINKVNVIRLKTLKPILFTPLMFGLNSKLNELDKSKKIDVIHIAWPNPSALALLLNKKARKIPWVLQWHSDMVTKNSSKLLKMVYFFFRPLERLLLKKVKVVIASTKEYMNYSKALSHFKGKCEIVPLGLKHEAIEIAEIDFAWANKLWQDSTTRIYHIGRFTFYKNQKLIIETAQLLPDVKFILTGCGELEKKIKQLIQKLNLKNVVLTGALPQNKLNALLSSCDAFCLPSNDRAESYGVVLLEALALNKNILVSDLKGSGMRWIASSTSLGQTFDCNDANDLALKIKNLNINTKSIKLAKHFTIESCAESIDQIYQNLS